MNRITPLVTMLLSFSSAWLLYVLGYIFSPIAQQVITSSDQPLGLERASKILLWGAAVCLISGLFSAAGIMQKNYSILTSTISIVILIVAILASVVSISLYFFTPICC